MKIIFDDKSFLEISKNNDKYMVTISAKDFLNNKKLITNSVALTKEQFEKLISDLK